MDYLQQDVSAMAEGEQVESTENVDGQLDTAIKASCIRVVLGADEERKPEDAARTEECTAANEERKPEDAARTEERTAVDAVLCDTELSDPKDSSATAELSREAGVQDQRIAINVDEPESSCTIQPEEEEEEDAECSKMADIPLAIPSSEAIIDDRSESAIIDDGSESAPASTSTAHMASVMSLAIPAPVAALTSSIFVGDIDISLSLDIISPSGSDRTDDIEIASHNMEKTVNAGLGNNLPLHPIASTSSHLNADAQDTGTSSQLPQRPAYADILLKDIELLCAAKSPYCARTVSGKHRTEKARRTSRSRVVEKQFWQSAEVVDNTITTMAVL